MQEKLQRIKEYAKENDDAILTSYIANKGGITNIAGEQFSIDDVKKVFDAEKFQPEKLPTALLIILGELGRDPKAVIDLLYKKERVFAKENREAISPTQTVGEHAMSIFAQHAIYQYLSLLPQEVLSLPEVLIPIRSQIMDRVLDGVETERKATCLLPDSFDYVGNIAYQGQEKKFPEINSIKFAKREIGRLNKEGKSPEEIADYMLKRANFKTINEMCEKGQGLLKGGHTVLEYLLLFINKICLGKDITGIKAQDETRGKVQEELNKRVQKPEAGGRGQD